MRSWAAQGGRSVLHLPLSTPQQQNTFGKTALGLEGETLKPLQANLPHDTCQSPYFKILLGNLF